MTPPIPFFLVTYGLFGRCGTQTFRRESHCGDLGGCAWATDTGVSGPEKDCVRLCLLQVSVKWVSLLGLKASLPTLLWTSFPLLLQVSVPCQIAPFSLIFKLSLLLKFRSHISYLKNLLSVRNPYS